MTHNNKYMPSGYKDSPLGVIPQEWGVKRIKDTFENVANYSYSREQMTFESQKYMYIHYGDIHKNIDRDIIDLNKISLPYVLTEVVADKKVVTLKNGDIILADASEDYEGVGKSIELVNSNQNEIIAGLHTIVLRPLNQNIFVGFGRYIFRSYLGKKNLERISQGTKVYSISYNLISQLNILLPPIEEQERIAEVLGCWDEAIERQRRMVELLTTRKRALMQRLLTPKPHWQKTKLGEIAERVTRKNTENNANVMTISAQRGFICQTDFFNKSIASETLDNYFLVHKDEFCYNKSYCNGYPMGAIKRLNNADKAVVTTLYICFRIKTDKYNIEFFEQYFEAGLLNRHLMKIANEGGRAHGLLNVTPSDFFAMMIDIPSLAEQKSVAEKFSTADGEIDLARHRLDLLRTQKRALMQQLLTGKKRLSV